MELITVYSVMSMNEGGDIFKGYPADTPISSHLSKDAADIVSNKHSARYVIEEHDYFHESFVQKMERDDAIILGNYSVA